MHTQRIIFTRSCVKLFTFLGEKKDTIIIYNYSNNSDDFVGISDSKESLQKLLDVV